MYRRRHRAREIAFSFDSFLDVVANVIGIVVRLILVAWVGARSYTATVATPEPAPAVAEAPPPAAEDDPVCSELETIRRQLADARLRLLERLGSLQLAGKETHHTAEELAELQARHRDLDEEAKRLGVRLTEKGTQARAAAASAAASADELRQRLKETLAQIKKIEAQPKQTQLLRYHTPVSRIVHEDEMFFECRQGRVSFIDISAFMQEIRATLDEKSTALRSQWSVAATTSSIGAFRLRYTVERDKSAMETIGGGPAPSNFRYGLSEWVVEPTIDQRGEPLEVALRDNSEFRKLADRFDPQITVVTFWIYADSFEIFRRLRDYLYERDIEVAGRPLMEGAPIAASRHGTASRGQ